MLTESVMLQSNSIITNGLQTTPRIDIEAMIKTKLPPLPGSVIRILNLLQDPNVSNRALANAVGYDPSLTTRMLRLANSPIYYLQRKVTSIQKAIDIIGIRSLYDILMLGVAAESFSNEIRNSVIGRVIWEHSLTVALFAKELSQTLGLRGSEEVFICGLLHDIGKIMLLRTEPEAYRDVLETNTEAELLAWETETFGVDHAEIGAVVSRGWKLPDEVSRVILNHHKASHFGNFGIVSHLINVADIVANVNGYGLRLDDLDAFSKTESMTFLKLDMDQLETAWSNIESRLCEVMKVFG